MVRDWGMNDRLGFVYYGEDDQQDDHVRHSAAAREYSEQTQQAIDEEVKKLIDALYEETRQLLEPTATARRAGQGAAAVRDARHERGRSHHAWRTADQADGERPARKESAARSRHGHRPGTSDAEPDVRLGGGPLPSPG
jgi:hypothetical protein